MRHHRNDLGFLNSWFGTRRTVVQIHSPRPLFRISDLQYTKIRRAPGPRPGRLKSARLGHFSLESNTYSHLQTGSDLIVGPFAPTTAFFEWKLEAQANSFSNFFAERHVVPDFIHGSDMARRPPAPFHSSSCTMEWRCRRRTRNPEESWRNNNSPATGRLLRQHTAN